jgi:hypothetical protein
MIVPRNERAAVADRGLPVTTGRFGISKSGVLSSSFQVDGMDAPLHNGIRCARVVVSSSHLNEEERPR